MYVGSYDHKLYAFDAQTGSILWAAETGDIIISKPAVADGIVCVGSEDYNLYAFDAATGTKLWSFTTGYYVDSDPAIVDGVVYFGSEDSKVYALSLHTGALLWSYQTGGSNHAFLHNRQRRQRLCGFIGPQTLCPKRSHRLTRMELHNG